MMEIEANPVGTDGKIRYFVRHKESTIAWFDDVLSAGTVMRYLLGASMTAFERDLAIAELRKFDNRSK